MPVLDFIDVNDDIIDLSSDEETDQQDHITTQSRVTSHDGLVADEELSDVFVEAAQRTQEATQSGNTVRATASSSVEENMVRATTSSSVVDNIVKATAAAQSCAPTTQTCPPTAGAFPSPTSTIPEALTFGGHDVKLVRAKMQRPRKNYHTETPRRSPRLEGKYKVSSKSMKYLAVNHNMSGMLEPLEESAALTNNAESSYALSSRPLGCESLSGLLTHGWRVFRRRRSRCSNKSVEESAGSISNAESSKTTCSRTKTKVD